MLRIYRTHSKRHQAKMQNNTIGQIRKDSERFGKIRKDSERFYTCSGARNPAALSSEVTSQLNGGGTISFGKRNRRPSNTAPSVSGSETGVVVVVVVGSFRMTFVSASSTKARAPSSATYETFIVPDAKIHRPKSWKNAQSACKAAPLSSASTVLLRCWTNSMWLNPPSTLPVDDRVRVKG